MKQLPGGDCIVSIRHDGATGIVVKGTDPQTVVDDNQLSFRGELEKGDGQ